MLFGDPEKPRPYVVRLRWLPGNMSRPHKHPNDRFILVISGTWWLGSGDKYEPEKTVPVKAGTYGISLQSIDSPTLSWFPGIKLTVSP